MRKFKIVFDMVSADFGMNWVNYITIAQVNRKQNTET